MPAQKRNDATTRDRSGSLPEATVDCDATTELGDPICCGRSDELPGLSCVDLTGDGTIYGQYGRCLEQGERFDARFIGGACCDGLTPIENEDEYEGEPINYKPGCYPISESGRLCSACGNGECEPVENSCNCAEDCP